MDFKLSTVLVAGESGNALVKAIRCAYVEGAGESMFSEFSPLMS